MALTSSASCVDEIIDTVYSKMRELREQVNQNDSLQYTTLPFIKDLLAVRRELTDVQRGCILVTVRCPTLEALDDLLNGITNGLPESFAETFFTKELKATIDVRMSICPLEYAQCKRELTDLGKALPITC